MTGEGSRRVLLVDDSPAVTEIMGAHLEGAGYAVSVAGDVDEAIATAHGARPDVALLDLQLPSGSGFDVLRALRRDRALLHTAVVMVTREVDPARAVEALDLGADDFMRKPFEPVELLARVHAVLRRRAAKASQVGGSSIPGDGCLLDRPALRGAVTATGGEPAALVGVRVDHVRAVNRRLGERRGDALLAAAAKLLAGAAGQGAPVGRLAGTTLAAVVHGAPADVVTALPHGVVTEGAQAPLRSAWVPIDPALPEAALVAVEDLLDQQTAR